MYYKSVQYGVRQDTGEIDYEEVERLAREHQPRLIICGHSAYPRLLDFERFAAVARRTGALLLADIAHLAGLVVAGVHPSPVPHADVVTTTTHKSLRGPRGGMILCRSRYAEAIDKAVFPGLQGGPHNHTTAAIAVALREASTEEFRRYAARIVENAQALAAALQRQGFRVITGGTQNHLVVVDATSMGVTGRQLAKAMDAAGMVCNFNRIPFDPQPAMHPSGVRLGTPATTSRGFGPEQMERIAAWMAQVARVRADAGKDLEARKKTYREIAAQVKAVCDRFPAPGLLYGPGGRPV
jgi:glycine hydroxymethyltransferase